MKPSFKNLLSISSFIASIAIALALTGCGGGGGGGGGGTPTTATLTSIAITSATVTVVNGTTANLTATGTYSDGTTANITTQVAWTSAAPVTASVGSATGVVTGVAAGTTTVTASMNAVTSPAANITVTNTTLTSIAITPATVTVANGTTANLTATGTYSDGTTANITTQVAWTSAAPVTASVGSATGVVTGVAAGTTTVTASMNAVTSPAANITVTNTTLTSIAITPATVTVVNGTTANLTATGTYSDTTTGNISGSVTWVSSNVAVAKIDNTGLATALAIGSTNISASSGGVTSNIAALTVTAAPTLVPAFTSMLVSGYHTVFGIAANGDLWGWGWNSRGELGNGTTTDTITPNLLGSGYSNISPSQGGDTYVHAVKADGTLMFWGSDIFHTGAADVLTPQAIGTGFVKVATSTYSSAAIKTDGSLWVWGGANFGGTANNLAGDGTNTLIATPKQIGVGYATVSVGTIHRLAVKQDGTLWGWGDGTCGALGPTAKNSFGYTSFLVPTQIGTGYKDAVAFATYSTIALKTDGSLWSWGQQYAGLLGDGVTAAGCRDTPQQIGTGFTVIAGDNQYAMALKADGSLWSWGHLSISSTNTGADSIVPKQIGTGFVKIFMNTWRAYAIATDGSLWAWGDEYDSGFANTFSYSAIPVKIH